MTAGSARKSLVALPVVMTLLAAAAVTLLWAALRNDQEARVATIVEATSYAARSEMARQLLVQFRAIDRVSAYWSEFARMPVEQWRADALIEIDHFDGLEVIAWVEMDGPRFFSNGPTLALDHVPTDEEWERIQSIVADATAVDRALTADLAADEDGHAVNSLYRPSREGRRTAVLIAIIDITSQVESILDDESPGYDIAVTCCDGIELYRTGDFTADIPEMWVSGGLIEPMAGLLWRVDLQPSQELATGFRSWSLNTVLIVGLALALAIGAIAYHSRRADERARAAGFAEMRVRSLNEQLEQRVAQRTEDLNNALADLNTINLSVAHDIRNPLNTVGLSLEGLKANGTADSSTALARMQSGLDHIAAIVERLLALSRVSAFVAERDWLDMESVSREVAGEFALGDRVEIRVNAMPSAYADETMVRILLTNQISNALRFANERGIEIGSREESGTVYFVRDFGAGLEPGVAGDLFKPSRKPRDNGDGSGLGLGLSIVARAAARHGGSVWAEDTPGGGATFCFRLPEPGSESDV